MSKGAEPTPVQLTPRYSLWGGENMRELISQLRAAGVDIATIDRFDKEVARLRDANPGGGQIDPITTAAESFGFEVHWIH